MQQTLNILVVDDEPGMRDGATRVLEGFTARFEEPEADVSYTVQTAASGEQALAVIGERPPAILLLDYKLPGISGLDVLAEIQGRGLDMVTVMITAYASLETAITATKQGAFDFLAKPFTPQELRTVIRKATSQLLLAREARRLADERRRIRFEFISVLAHELKAPLNAVESYLNVIETRLRDAGLQDLERPVTRSQARIRAMRKLITDLIDMTRIESGTMARELVETDLAELARGVLEAQEPTAADRRITLALEAVGPIMAVVDRGEVEIAVGNLVSNAIKYNRDGGRVVVTVAETRGAVRIAVRDTGIGMTEAEAARLFGDFVRIRNEQTQHIEGSGLGLSTTRKIAALYGGDVTVASTPGVGSTFTLVLPRP